MGLAGADLGTCCHNWQQSRQYERGNGDNIPQTCSVLDARIKQESTEYYSDTAVRGSWTGWREKLRRFSWRKDSGTDVLLVHCAGLDWFQCPEKGWSLWYQINENQFEKLWFEKLKRLRNLYQKDYCSVCSATSSIWELFVFVQRKAHQILLIYDKRGESS